MSQHDHASHDHAHAHVHHQPSKAEHNASLFALSALQRLLLVSPLLILLWLAVWWALGDSV